MYFLFMTLDKCLQFSMILHDYSEYSFIYHSKTKLMLILAIKAINNCLSKGNSYSKQGFIIWLGKNGFLNTTIVNRWIIVYHVLIRNLLKLTTCYDKLWINVYITVLFCKRKRQNKAFTIFVSLHEFCVYLQIPLSRSF